MTRFTKALALSVACTVLLPSLSHALESEVEDIVIDLARQFQEKTPSIALTPRVGVLETNAPNSAVSALLTAAITETVSRSAAFITIERGRLDEIIEEQKLSLSGLMDEDSVPAIGEIEGVEILLLSSISESGRTYRLAVRLVDAETGRVVAASGADLPRTDIDAESADYLADAFRSRYGISLRPTTGVMVSPWDEHLISVTAVEALYRVAPFLSAGLGYGNFVSGTPSRWDSEQFVLIVDSVTYDVQRTYAFFGDSLRLIVSGNITPTPRLHIGIDATMNLFVSSYIQEDLPGFPVYHVVDNTPTVAADSSRIIVDGFTHDLYASYEFSLKADYLLSQRLSLLIRPGYFIFPVYRPQGFRSGEMVQDSYSDGVYTEADIDNNGTFSEYQGFNFARDSAGNLVSYSAHGFMITVGVAVHF